MSTHAGASSDNCALTIFCAGSTYFCCVLEVIELRFFHSFFFLQFSILPSYHVHVLIFLQHIESLQVTLLVKKVSPRFLKVSNIRAFGKNDHKQFFKIAFVDQIHEHHES